jgi:DNA repair protein RecO (recombination protein O)
MLPRGDPHPGLFTDYVTALAALARGADAGVAPDATLRIFELDLLVAAGHAPRFDLDEQGGEVVPGRRYHVDAERGIVAAMPPRVEDGGAPADGTWDGAVLLALAQRRFDEPALRNPLRDVLRGLIRYHLHGRPLNTRRIFQDLKAL